MALIILNRDGVINHSIEGGIKSPNEWEPIDGSLEAIARLNQAGYSVVVVTNQPELAKETFDTEALTKIHSKMRRMLAQVGGKIESIVYSPTELNDDFSNYSELENPLFDLTRRLRVNLTEVITVGCCVADVFLAKAVKAKPILVETDNNEIDLKNSLCNDVETYKDLAEMVDTLLHGHV